MRRARCSLLVLAAIAWSFPSNLVAASSGARSAADGYVANAGGLQIVGPDILQNATPEGDGALPALEAAYTLIEDHRGDFGYPWFDVATKTLRLRPVTTLGSELAMDLANASPSVSLEKASVSVAELDALADALTQLNGTGFPNADLIWKTEPDELNNRIIVTVGKATPELLSALAARFGVTSLAVRVQPVPRSGSANRDADSPPFWGGAAIGAPAGGCTTGYAWIAGTGAMAFAGHCAPSGGYVSYTGYHNAGTVTSASEENWSTTTGTVYMTGQSVYRGDVGLIRYSSGYTSNATIYSGEVHTSTNAIVGEMHSVRSRLNDAACMSGTASGYHCGTVNVVGTNVWYNDDGPNVWARNVVNLYENGECAIPGDSGAPVFTTRADGKVVAWGVVSGYVDAGLGVCSTVYTDIWDVYYGLPGSLKTR